MREVFINRNNIDVSESDNVGYQIESPIFKDISIILSNRTTTYKIPKTDHNIKILELCNHPEVVNALFPYRRHVFEEHRSGIPFIKGQCTLIRSADDFELKVIWGSTISMQVLQELELRKMNLPPSEYMIDPLSFVGNGRIYLASGDNNQMGFLAVDYGKGLTNTFEGTQPCVTFRYVIDMIERVTGVSLQFPDRLEEALRKTWIPLLENNGGNAMWNDYKVEARSDRAVTELNVGGDVLLINYVAHIIPIDAIVNNKNIIDRNIIKWSKFPCKVEVFYHLVVKDKNPPITNGKYKNMVASITGFGSGYYDNREIEIEADSEGIYNVMVSYEFDITDESTDNTLVFYPTFGYTNGTTRSRFNDPEVLGFNLTATIKMPEVNMSQGDKYPIIENLPDMSAVAFIKNIMQMYGLYAFYRGIEAENVIKLFSIDDMYERKHLAYDWTHKLAETSQEKDYFAMEYEYGGYAQKNLFKYKEEKEVLTNADGYVRVDSEHLEKTKNLIELAFAPTDNQKDDRGNEYAKINLFDSDGNRQSVANRVLYETEYKRVDSTESYKSAHFDEALSFSGDKGLLNTYYNQFQHILLYPVVCWCRIYLNDLELATFDESMPIYIDGTYYMLVTMTVQTIGDNVNVCACKIIKMPPLK